MRSRAPSIRKPNDRWLERLCEYKTFVADDATGKAIGWISMSEAGYIDMLFCLPEATRRGVAEALYAAVESEACRLAVPRITAHASLFAQPFLKRRGWIIERHETIVRNGVEIKRAVMSKTLNG